METTCLIIFTLLFLVFQTYCTSSSNTLITPFSNVTCVEKERQSLLEFKRGLRDKSNRLSSWAGLECCEWQGVGCDMRNSHVVKLDLRSPSFLNEDYTLNTSDGLQGKVSPALLNLKRLYYLDLSLNNFSGQKIPEFFGSFKYLEYLNISYSGFSGVVPPHLGNLSRLQYLDLNFIDRYYTKPFPYDISLMVKDDMWWVSLLTSLKHLDFSGITIGYHIDWFRPINTLPSLLTLNLASCDINIATIKVINFTSLNSLDLSSNAINSTIPAWLSNLTGLVHLNLRNNNFHGGIPDSIGTLSSLSSIKLSYNQLSGPIPPSLGGLSSLTTLSLWNNQLSGNIPTSLGQLSNLQYLSLQDNQLSGNIPISLGQLSNLEFLALFDNELNGSIPESIGLLTSLQMLWLHGNQLSGNIPTSIGQLSNLRELVLLYNQLSGVVSEDHFTKLYNLTDLYLSGNSLITWNVSRHWIPPFQLFRLEASSCCNMGPQFPNWLQTQTHLEVLNLSNSSIRDTIPEWFQNISSHLQYLDLSDNHIGPKFPDIQISTDLVDLLLSNSGIRDTIPEWFHNISSHLRWLDLSDNHIGGNLSRIIANNTGLEVVALRNNLFTGSVPTNLCELYSIMVLDLSHNNFFGILPKCLGSLIQLQVMDLTSNNITGDIPNSLGSLSLLESLHLRNNKFEGNLSMSLQNLKNLVTVDLGNNSLTGNIPVWIGKKLSKLKILNLQSNMFMGMIPPKLCQIKTLKHLNLADNKITGVWIGKKLSKLKILNLQSNMFMGMIPPKLCQIKTLKHLNLADNKITGNIPHCFCNLTGMIKSDFKLPYKRYSNVYEENIEACIKGIQLKYTSTLPYLISLDLSSNKIIGEIPDVLMNLEALTNLNLSRNELSGHIPTIIGNLKSMESLDLSMNKLSGRIPLSLARVNTLGYLNLSFNKLSGPLPIGNHFQTFDNPAIYEGNNRLCGFPILSCKGNNLSYNHGGDDEGLNCSQGFSWFYAGMVPGFVVGFMGLIVSLHYIRIWRVTYFEMIENIYVFLMVSIVLTFARLRRKCFQ